MITEDYGGGGGRKFQKYDNALCERTLRSHTKHVDHGTITQSDNLLLFKVTDKCPQIFTLQLQSQLPIDLVNVVCGDNETELAGCSFATGTEDCQHSEDVFLFCGKLDPIYIFICFANRL